MIHHDSSYVGIKHHHHHHHHHHHIIMFKDVRIIDILTSLGEYHKPLQHSELCESP